MNLDSKIIGFKQTVREFLAKKTNWLGMVGLIGAIAAYVTGEITLSAAINTGGMALGAIFIRDSLS